VLGEAEAEAEAFVAALPAPGRGLPAFAAAQPQRAAQQGAIAVESRPYV
jgi:hypothetical protein